MGDADADGALTVSDALMILRHAMGLSELPENRITLCDADTDSLHLRNPPRAREAYAGDFFTL